MRRVRAAGRPAHGRGRPTGRVRVRGRRGRAHHALRAVPPAAVRVPRPRARAAHPGGGAGDRRGAAGRLRPGRPGAGGPSLTCGALPGPLARVGG
ncbi:Peptide chain release factor 2 (fragment) [Micrococcus luteus]